MCLFHLQYFFTNLSPQAPLPKTSPSGKKLAPIRALNPYNNNWTIRARVARKDPTLRSFHTAKGDSNVFNIELVDDDGTAIEATLWRDLAAAQHARIEVGKLYYISNGQLKPADRRYSTVRNHYCMHLDARTVIEEAPADQQASAARMEARLQYVAFADLGPFINSKATVDIIGVATQVNPLGSVKRKADQTELPRRDITLVDATRKSVNVTLWGEMATDFGARLEGMTLPVVSLGAVRVSDYNGLSLSTVTRSTATADPNVPEARKLKDWYEAEGRSAEIVAANEGLGGTGRGSGAERSGPRPTTFASAVNDLHMAADSKPEYHSLYVRFTSIRPDQTFYYLAAKEANNRKVVAVGDGTFRCDFDGNTYEASQVARRFIMLAQVTDATGQLNVNVFDDQAKDLFKSTADEMAELKEGGQEQVELFEQALKKPCLDEVWSMRVQVRPNEYNGEVRKRINVAAMNRVDFAKESKALIERIQAKL